MTRDFLTRVEDAIRAMGKAQDFIRAMDYDEFCRDEKTLYAVVRALEVAGEAVKGIPYGVRRRRPDFPWKEIAGMRDKLIHEYFRVKLRVVWETIKNELPGLEEQLRSLRDELKREQGPILS